MGANGASEGTAPNPGDARTYPPNPLPWKGRGAENKAPPRPGEGAASGVPASGVGGGGGTALRHESPNPLEVRCPHDLSDQMRSKNCFAIRSPGFTGRSSGRPRSKPRSATSHQPCSRCRHTRLHKLQPSAPRRHLSRHDPGEAPAKNASRGSQSQSRPCQRCRRLLFSRRSMT